MIKKRMARNSGSDKREKEKSMCRLQNRLPHAKLSTHRTLIKCYALVYMVYASFFHRHFVSAKDTWEDARGSVSQIWIFAKIHARRVGRSRSSKKFYASAIYTCLSHKLFSSISHESSLLTKLPNMHSPFSYPPHPHPSRDLTSVIIRDRLEIRPHCVITFQRLAKLRNVYVILVFIRDVFKRKLT